MARERLIWYGVDKIPKHFSDEEIAKMINCGIRSKAYWNGEGRSKSLKDWGDWLRLRDVCIVATCLLCGLRPKECCCLKFSDFDFKTMYLRIDSKSNKTRKERVIPVPKALMKFYKPYFKYSKSRFWRGSDYLFPSMENNHVSPERIKYIFREKFLKPSGLWLAPKSNNKYTPTRLYAMRHTFATRTMKKMIDKKGEVDIYALANLLGHSDLRSTQKYLHTDEKYGEYLRELVEA